MSVGNTTSRTLSVIECLDEWITHPAITSGFNQFFMAVEAELTELDELHLYLWTVDCSQSHRQWPYKMPTGILQPMAYL